MNIPAREFKRKKTNTNLTDRKGTKPFRGLRETRRTRSKVGISEHKRVEERLGKLNECLLNFETNPDENINRLVALCGEELRATCALYNRLEDGLLRSIGQWNTPIDYVSVDKPDGHICYDLIQSGQDDVHSIRNLQKTIYAQTDPNVIRYGLKTYVGKAVTFGGTIIGSLCAVYQNDHVLSEEDKKFLGIIASAIGVEEKRKRAEEALRESEERFRDLYDHAPLGYHEYDKEGRITKVNHTDLEMLGYTTEEMIGQPIWKLNVGEEIVREQVMAKLAGILPPGKELERVYRRKDGTIFPVLIEDRLILDENGQIKGIRCTIQDITERKRAEEALRRSEEEAKRLAQENAIMAEIGRIISSTLNIEEVYERFAEEVRKLIPFDRIAIKIINSQR